MVRFLAPQEVAGHSPPWRVTVLVRRQDGRANRFAQWFGSEEAGYWWIEKRCKEIVRSGRKAAIDV